MISWIPSVLLGFATSAGVRYLKVAKLRENRSCAVEPRSQTEIEKNQPRNDKACEVSAQIALNGQKCGSHADRSTKYEANTACKTIPLIAELTNFAGSVSLR